jgi:hypothetical protein
MTSGPSSGPCPRREPWTLLLSARAGIASPKSSRCREHQPSAKSINPHIRRPLPASTLISPNSNQPEPCMK